MMLLCEHQSNRLMCHRNLSVGKCLQKILAQEIYFLLVTEEVFNCKLKSLHWTTDNLPRNAST